MGECGVLRWVISWVISDEESGGVGVGGCDRRERVEAWGRRVSVLIMCAVCRRCLVLSFFLYCAIIDHH